MTTSSTLAAIPAAPSLTPASAAIAQAARLLLPDLERGRRVDAAILRAAMEAAFGAADAAGAWDWKIAYYYCIINSVAGSVESDGCNTGIDEGSLQSRRPTADGSWRSSWGRGAVAGSGAPRGR